MDKSNSLTPATTAIVKQAATEPPHTSPLIHHKGDGTYLCRRCGYALFRSTHKFISSCGWPSFDEEIDDRIKRLPDPDGMRTEIQCMRCDAHLGHVFVGERLTEKNLRHCVNGLALDFVADTSVMDTEEAIVAGGCFWGVQHLLNELPGVVLTEVGYTGGETNEPTYRDVCSGTTGHVEAVRVVYDPARISFESVIRYFLEIHDPTQADGQGPDHGSQYVSVIFYYDAKQHEIAKESLDILRDKGLNIATELSPVAIFWPAEEYHQDYYTKNNKAPYCHRYTKRFS